MDRLREMFWMGGLTNPLDVIEQITYLMFILLATLILAPGRVASICDYVVRL